jgi:geranylgeranyl diphosphate synthase type II
MSMKSSPMNASLEAACADHVSSLRALVNQALPELVADAGPDVLYDPVRYVLDGGGKRVRPVLLLLSAEAFAVDTKRALPAALAVEVFHNFTLVHDDIMDHADERRGRPTVHLKWDPETAILTGDMLMALSYDLLSQVDTPHLPQMLEVYHAMVERLCKGQALDKAFETQDETSVQDYMRMIDCKTGALLAAAFELGGLIGGAAPAQRTALRKMGRRVGRAFQIQDDLLDLTADNDQWGKQVGGDLMAGKKTFLLLRALERADGEDRAWFARIVTENGLPAHDIPEARERMRCLGIFEEAEEAVEEYTAGAKHQLAALPADEPAVQTIRWLIEQMKARMY